MMEALITFTRCSWKNFLFLWHVVVTLFFVWLTTPTQWLKLRGHRAAYVSVLYLKGILNHAKLYIFQPLQRDITEVEMKPYMHPNVSTVIFVS